MHWVICSFCSKEFLKKGSQIKRCRKNFCSSKCLWEWKKNGEIVACFVCGKKIYKQRRFLLRSKSRKFFCSNECRAKWNSSELVEENSPNWVNGKFVYKKILSRTGITKECVLCGTNDPDILAVHHIDKNHNHNQPSNLSWLCHNCHHLVHHYKDEANIFMTKIKNGVSKM